MNLANFPLGQPKPAPIAAVFPSRESAAAAVSAVLADAGIGEDDVRIVGPLEQLLERASADGEASWAVVVQAASYAQSRNAARALRHPARTRRGDAAAQSKSPAAAGLVAGRP